MLKKEITVQHRGGLNARVAADIVTESIRSGDEVILSKGSQEARGNSIIELLFLAADKGHTVELSVTGENKETTVRRLEEIFEGGAGI